MSRIRRLERIEGLMTQRQHQAEMDDLEALAESARMRIVQYLDARRRGEPLPILSAPSDRNREPSEARERLLVRLKEMRERLLQYAELQATYGIR
jgi:hypothetical protein